ATALRARAVAVVAERMAAPRSETQRGDCPDQRHSPRRRPGARLREDAVLGRAGRLCWPRSESHRATESAMAEVGAGRGAGHPRLAISIAHGTVARLHRDRVKDGAADLCQRRAPGVRAGALVASSLP